MALVRRISRLFAADMHAVLDQLEEPEIVLKQAVREMEAELAGQAEHTKRLEGEIDAAGARLGALAKTRGELDSKLDLCFERGNDELARKLIRRKLESARLSEHLEAKRAGLEDRLAEHKTLVASNHDRLESMRQKAELFGADEAAADDGAWREPHVAIDDDDVEIAFLREQQARSRS